ncbi:MAG: rhamnogalacturonan acetylesterase [Verrucomicrobia bacterium]|nr:rhamnogalacturonan acetylesterase [Verrucomicrobiota bacterium]
MKTRLLPALLLCLTFTVGWSRAAEPPRPKLYLIGGSTMASFPPTRPVVGWGQTLPKFFKDPAQIDNRALSGRSSKSFIDQGHWAKVIADIRAGDFLIMCWGTNDSSSDPARKTDPRTTFRGNLLRFIAEIRAKGATPILATQVAHRRWDPKGQWTESASDYVLVNRELAVSEHVPLMEMFDRTTALEQSLGVEGSIALHLYLPAGKYDSYPNGAKDDTHYNEHGATRVAEVAVQEIRRLNLPLVAWLREPTPAAAKPGPR